MINVFGLKAILAKEFERIRVRRRKAGDRNPDRDPSRDIAGIALSGGGIRSATFNLGLLQALESEKLLERMDYMSTVSGGGYIGSSLIWLMEVFKEFPFGTKREDHAGIGGNVLAWLRAHGKYLTPGEGLNIWSLGGAVITGTMINLIILVPFFLMLFYLMTIDTGVIPEFSDFIPWLQYKPDSGIFFLITAAGGVAFLVFVITAIFYSLISRMRGSINFDKERAINRFKGKLLKYCVCFFIVGTIPIVKGYLGIHMGNWIQTFMSAISLTGILAVWLGKRSAGKTRLPRGGSAFTIGLGLTLAVYGIFLWFYHISSYLDIYILFPIFIFSTVLSIFAEINHVSIHRYYRNRLMEAYMPSTENLNFEKGDSTKYPDNFLLKDIKQNKYPYHIINTNLQAVGSNSPKLSSRGGESFIFSPCFCGSDSTAYVQTEDYLGGAMNLATAFAISGAALNPNTCMTRSRPLSFIMGLFNIRLGYWIRNPKKDYIFKKLRLPTQWLFYILRELFGKGLNEDTRNIHLSDGGHFENLGLYELIRRRCRYIVVSDAGEDKDWKFADLAKVIEMVRLDFGADINIDVSPLIPGEDGYSKKPYVFGTVTYSSSEDADGVITGRILYIKTALVKNRKEMREDIYGYQRAHSDFPDQSTMDQFFSEPQFEAYRELGFCIGKMSAKGVNRERWFE